MVTGKVLQACRDARATTKTCCDGVDLFLNRWGVALHVRRDFGQAGMKDKHAGVCLQRKGAGHAQKQRGVRLHGAAHISQDEQTRWLFAIDFPSRLHQLAAPGHAAAQGLA